MSKNKKQPLCEFSKATYGILLSVTVGLILKMCAISIYTRPRLFCDSTKKRGIGAALRNFIFLMRFCGTHNSVYYFAIFEMSSRTALANALASTKQASCREAQNKQCRIQCLLLQDQVQERRKFVSRDVFRCSAVMGTELLLPLLPLPFY